MTQSYGLSYNETIFLSYQNVPHVKIACSYLNEGGLYLIEGSPLVNIFMCNFRNIWLRDCSNDFRPVFYIRYVHDIFALFSSPVHADKCKGYL